MAARGAHGTLRSDRSSVRGSARRICSFGYTDHPHEVVARLLDTWRRIPQETFGLGALRADPLCSQRVSADHAKTDWQAVRQPEQSTEWQEPVLDLPRTGS